MQTERKREIRRLPAELSAQTGFSGERKGLATKRCNSVCSRKLRRHKKDHEAKGLRGFFGKLGGAYRIRTDDLLHAMQAL